jgi:predicted aminopeptidase
LKVMSPEQLVSRLDGESIVRLAAADWDALAPRFTLVERHDTFLRGDLLIVRTPAGLAAVESPSTGDRVVRRLASEEAARRFVADRLETYERMWNGCGCRIDYDR